MWKLFADVMLFYCCILEHAPPKNKRNSIITVPSYKFVCDCVCMHTLICYIGTCSGKELGCAQEMLMNVQKQSKTSSVFCWVFATTEVKATLDVGQRDRIFIATVPGQCPSNCLQKQEFAFTTGLTDKETILVEMGLFLNLLASGWGNRC